MDASLRGIGLLSDLQQQMLLVTDEDITLSNPRAPLPGERSMETESSYLGLMSKELKAVWALQRKLSMRVTELETSILGFSRDDVSAQDIRREILKAQKTLTRIETLLPLFFDWDFPVENHLPRAFWVGHGFKVYSRTATY